MVDRAYDKKFFAEWLKDARRDQRLDEGQFAEKLGVSVGSCLVWEVGNTPWASIPAEYKRKIQKICGRFPQEGTSFVLSRQEYRQFGGTNPQPNLASQIAQGFIDSHCSKCGTAILVKHEGRCPECRQAVDGGL